MIGRVREGRRFPILGALLFHLYGLWPWRCLRGRFRSLVLLAVRNLEGGEDLSLTLRRIFSHFHQIDVGLYTSGPCFSVANFRAGPPGTKIGRYCSLARTAARMNANHPTNTMSSHAMFCNPELGYVKRDTVRRMPLTIGNDVWLAHNSIILSTVTEIGDGAVIGAGAVLHQNVPPYAIVVGNPGRVVRYRFSPEIIRQVQESRWWEKPPEELLPELDSFQRPLEGDEIR